MYVRVRRINPRTKAEIELVDTPAAAEFDTEPSRWATVCRTHHRIQYHPTLALARYHMTTPWEWCEECEKAR